MKNYNDQEIKELVKQAMALNISLYSTTEIQEIETLIKHKLLSMYGEEIPK